MVMFSATVSLLIFCLLDPSIANRRILIFPAIQWICLFSPVFLSVVPLIFWHSVAKYIYTLSIAVNSLRVDPFIIIIMKTLSLSLIIFLVVKSALSRYYTYSSLLSVYLSPCITFNLSLSLNLKLISHRKHTVGSFKKIPSTLFYVFVFILDVTLFYRYIIDSSSVQSLSCVWLFVTPWTTACQASLSITNSQSLRKLMSTESTFY